MRFGERANIKYAKTFVEESKDKKNRMDQATVVEFTSDIPLNILFL
jgi:hypothetical protein